LRDLVDEFEPSDDASWREAPTKISAAASARARCSNAFGMIRPCPRRL